MLEAKNEYNKKYEEHQADKNKWEDLYVRRRELEMGRIQRLQNEETKALDEEEERLHWKVYGVSGKDLQGPRLPIDMSAAGSLAALQAMDESRRSRSQAMKTVRESK